MFKTGKRDATFLDGRSRDVEVKSSTKFQSILDFILDHAQNDERPYLKVSVLGKPLLGLLDSGATSTILGSGGWNTLEGLGIRLDSSKTVKCTVANGQSVQSIGECEIPFRVRDRIRLIKVLVVPELLHTLILGANFWKSMGIVPDLRHDEWHFSDQPTCGSINEVDHLRSQTILTSLQSSRLKALLDRNIALMGEELGCTDLAEHVIVTKSAPIKQRYYPVSPVIQAHIDKELDEMLSKDIVERSNSPWSSPVLLVKKKDGSYRFCVDYRKLNAVTERDSYPIPYVSHTLDKLKNAHYLSSLDIKSAYWQVPVAESSRPYTAFTVPGRGLFQFKRMPFGLHNSPATWQRLIDRVLGVDLEPHVFVYLDDVVVVTQTFEQHLAVLDEVFKRLRDARLTVSIEKCQFCRPEMKYLGYVIDRNGLHVDPDKVKAMLQLPVPKTVKEVRRIVGTFSWYRRFIPEFASTISPITALLKKSRKFVWTQECEESFQKIKECLISAPVLNCPDYSLPFEVQTDASAFGVAAVLTQPHPDGDRVVCYLSRSLTKQERNYSTTERECLAVLFALERLRPYIEGVPFTVITDHYSLVWLQNLKDPTGRLARWAVRLQQYDFKIVHRKGKDHVVPDALSRAVPILDSLETSHSSTDKWYNGMVKKVSENPLKFSNWRICSDRLYKYIRPSFEDLGDATDRWKEVVPKDRRKDVISASHDMPTSGHMGTYKTYNRVAEKYYWPKLRYDVANYVRKCAVCAAHKLDQKKPAGLMTAQPRVYKPWEMISTDLMGPLPRSTRGNKYILVVTDYFSKFSLVFPLRSATAGIIVRKIEEEVFLIFGVPRLLLCDNGPQYRSKQLEKLAKDYNVTLRYNANYHPQANPTERYNKTIKTMLSMYASDNHRTWDSNLAKIACATRTAKHDAIKQTPFYVNFGRRMVLNGEDFIKNRELESEIVELEQGVRQEGFGKLFKEIRRRLDEAAKKNERSYNLRRRHEEFLPNQLVWKRNYVLSDAANYFTSKLAPKYIGPFSVKRRVSPWTYELQDDKGRSKGVWNVKDLKSAGAIENLPSGKFSSSKGGVCNGPF